MVESIKKASLTGRGGADFPVALKWEAVKKAKSEIKYLVVNGAEGEPGAYKDEYILGNKRKDFILGIKLASDFIGAKKIYIYLRSDFFDKYRQAIKKEAEEIGIANKIIFTLKPLDSGYIAGEETTVLNIIEGKEAEPRIRPPYPSESGLFGKPTLVHNIETLYNISLLSQEKYCNERLYSVNVGDKNIGVYSLSSDLSIEEILRKTGNYPEYDFFVQVGGDADGQVLNMEQLDSSVSGVGSISIHDLKNHKPEELIRRWLKFFKDSSCGNCTPCREGTYRLYELFEEQGIDMIKDFRTKDLCDSLRSSSFCALGSAVPNAFLGYLTNICEYDNKDR